MNLKFYLNYFSKSHQLLMDLSKKTHINIFYLWFDYILSLIRYGCLIRQYVYGDFYRMTNFDRKKSLTYKKIVHFMNQVNQSDCISLLEDKRKFNLHFKDFVKRSWLFTLDMSYEEFSSFLVNKEKFIKKPLDLCEGEGVCLVQKPQNEIEQKKLYEQLHKEKCLIEEFVQQHNDMTFKGKSVNTIRMHTFLTSQGDVFCFKPVLRVGVGNSVIDNYCAGGCVYEVDVELGRVIAPSLSKDHKLYKVHPGTDIIMLGYQIPNWTKVLSGIKKAAKQLPECRFIGWDIAITKDGIELIEGNHNPDYEFLEFQGTKGWYEILKKFM